MKFFSTLICFSLCLSVWVDAKETAQKNPHTTSGRQIAEDPQIPTKDLWGMFGFDWLNPDSSKCKLFDSKMIDGLMQKEALCTITSGSTSFVQFEGNFYSCLDGQNQKKSKDWKIYQTKAKCIEQYETMKANGP